MSNQKQRAALYMRVSTREQAQKGTSIEAQDNELKRYAEKHNIEITGTYSDDGYSGTTTDRPKFQEMLSDAENGLFEIILIWKYDRFSRNLIDQEITILQLKKLNVSVESITEDGDILIRQIRGAVSEDEVRKTLQRSKLVKDMRAKQGYHLGRAPMGYSFDKNHDLQINSDSGKVLRIYQKCRNRKGKHKTNISRMARAYGITTDTIYNILKNPIYKGYVTYQGKQFQGRHEPILKGL